MDTGTRLERLQNIAKGVLQVAPHGISRSGKLRHPRRMQIGADARAMQLHPTLREAEKLKENYSARDRREMRRIARMQTDGEVFARKGPWTPVYRDIWRRYLETKGPDIVISFE